MRNVLVLFIVCVLIGLTVNLSAQLKSQVIEPQSVEDRIRVPGLGSSLLGLNLLNPDRFFMNHYYSLSMMTAGNSSMSMGVYQNSMSYIFSDQLQLNARIGFVHDPLHLGENSMQMDPMDNLIYGADLIYRPKENVLFNIRFDKVPYTYRVRTSPFGYYPYYHRY